MSNNEDVRLAIVGCGKLVTMFTLLALKKAKGIKLVALSDISEKRLKIVGKIAKIDKLYKNYDDLLKDPDVEALYIATPPSYHHKMMLKAFAAGKHVLCEKPLTANYSEALDIEKKAGKLIVLPGHNYAYSACLEWAQDIIKAGKIGEVQKISNFFDININLWKNVSKHQYDEFTGGVLYDHFAHLVYTAGMFGGKFHSIKEILLEKGNKSVHDKVIVRGHSDFGVESEIRASWHHLMFSWKMRIIGSKGTIYLDPQKTPYWIKVVDKKGKIIERRREKFFFEQLLSGYVSYQKEFEDFAGAIRFKKEPLVTLADGVETMRIIDSVKNWESQRVVFNDKVRVFAEDATYDNADGVIEKIFTQINIDFNGKKVLLKPNIIGSWSPEKGTTTHPAVVEGVIKAVEKRGGIVSVGDNPGTGGYGKSGQSGDKTGIKQAAGSRWVEMGKHPTKITADSKYFKELIISSDVLEADIIINLPKFKTHALTTISGSIKNMFGILIGGQKVQIHSVCHTPRHFSEALVDIYSIRKPDLTIMDAVVGMEGNGPTGGGLRKIGKIIASEDGTAVDSVMAVIMGISPMEIEQLKIAKDRNLGETSLNNIEILGEIVPVKRFKLPITFVKHDFIGSIANAFLFNMFGRPRLTVNKRLCEKCGVCYKHCPRRAIQLTPYPRFDRKKCIGCYCCFELCNPHAINIGSLLTRIARKMDSGK